MDGDRDDHGRLILGNPHGGCRWCHAPAIPTIAANGKAAWWHPPADCCTERRHAQLMADRAAASDRQ